MKALKITGILILILLVLVGILSFLAPTKMESERSITVNAPPEVVWQYICSLEKQNAWGPWREKDPDMKVTYTGEDCAVGSHSKWTSDVKDVGSGDQEITAIAPMRSVESSIQFHEPFESEAKAWTRMENDPAGGIKVTWGFNSNMPRPMNAMLLFMNVENSMNEMFDQGLHNLKTVAEKASATGEVQVMENTAPAGAN